ncbi:hypothetical protein ST47_g616 [Ascochyta rabiei]|uniref:Uncharacterized protein n=2 Tax=Didymella rabiei TaxID=5454 RepID=A0A163LZ50_DIDRA|nr:hypothetical protein ST47_g616 [Ascochyta rabiei]
MEAPTSRHRPARPNKAQAEAVQTYKEKAKQARERNNSIGVRVPPNIASYDYAYASTSKNDASIPTVLKPSISHPAPAGAFPVSPPAQQEKWAGDEQKPESVIKTSKVSSNTSVYRKPTVLGVTTAAAVIKESVQYVCADVNGGASRPTSPPKSTTVKVSMKPKIPTIKVETCKVESCRSGGCQVEHCRGMYYRTPHLEPLVTSRSPSPTKTMPNFTRQYSIEGDSIFGYKIKDPLSTSAGANNSSSSEDEKSKVTPNKTQDTCKHTLPKRTLTDRWPWIRKGTGAAIGKPPNAPAPDPPARAPTFRRPMSIYVSPFDSITAPPSTLPPTRPTPLRPVATAAVKATRTATATAPTTIHPASPKKPALVPRVAPTSKPVASSTSANFDTDFAQIKAFFLLTLKICLGLYAVVALWFILDAIREALCVVTVPFRLLGHIVGFVWAIVGFFGRSLGMAAGGAGWKIRVLGR